MPSSRAKRFLGLGGEAMLALVLCLVSFGLFLYILDVIFPSSRGLRELLAASAANVSGPEPRRSRLSSDIAESPAILRIVNPRVTHKRAEGLAWTTAKDGIELHGRDGVQTAAHGTASIDFGEQNVLHIGENTLIIIGETLRELDRPARQASVLMVEGRLWAEVGSHPDGVMALRVQTPAGAVRVASQEGTGPARMRVAVDPERHATFSVISGEARVETRGGSIKIGADHYVEIDSTGSASTVLSLPIAPVLGVPLPNVRTPARETMTFMWNYAASGTGYHLVVARDRGFRDLAVDVTTRGPSYRCERLRPGTYYWRVSTLFEGAEGPPSTARAIHLTTTKDGPKLAVNLPPAIVRGARHRVTGVTDADARVWISDVPVGVSAAGSFERQVVLRPGVNVVVVEAIDPDGNTTYRSAIVTVKP